MNKVFLKKDQLQLVNGGYLVDNNNNPVFNAEFVEMQKHAEYVITTAELAEGRDFKGKEADSYEQLKLDVLNKLATKEVKYIKTPDEVKLPLKSQLAIEALAFITYTKEKNKTEIINNYLQRFNIINEFEEFGLFFDQEIVKLNKIYTIEEITNAVVKVIDFLL